MAGQDWMEKDFYATLGVDKSASAADIKKAYRKKARTLHPDANPGDAAAEQRFKAVGEAYAVLSDAQERQQYDAVRAMTGGGARFTSGGGGGAGGFEDLLGGIFGAGQGAGQARQRVRFDTGGTGGAGGMPPGFEDLLSGVFASGGAGGQYDQFGASRGPRKGADLSARTTVEFAQAVQGATVTLRAADGQQVTVRVPPGVRDGQKIRLRGKGQAGDPGAPVGDLVIEVAVRPHPVFSRSGNDLRITLPVTFPEAALGAEVGCPTLDGTTVRLRVPAGTPSGRTLRVKGRGVTTGKGTGDLLVTLQVVVPQRLDGDARGAVERFRELTAGEDPRAALVAEVEAAR